MEDTCWLISQITVSKVEMDRIRYNSQEVQSLEDSIEISMQGCATSLDNEEDIKKTDLLYEPFSGTEL